MAQTNDALIILDRMIGDDADMRQMIAEETLKAQMARLSYEARTAAGLTQPALAARVGTTPSASGTEACTSGSRTILPSSGRMGSGVL
jgi:hypothetical protein